MVAIALLTTGDEVIEGDILNRNAQTISQMLTDDGFRVNSHLSCRDNEDDIKNAIAYLSQKHQAIILTGGLGPTADDKTRYALASYLDRTLEFYQPTWQWIVDRYQRLQIELPETNRQQAFFPKGASVIHNANGSADGAFVEISGLIIFMLPGPPRECLPMIKVSVLPTLRTFFSVRQRPLLKWRVFGISESSLAQKLQDEFGELAKKIGYRWHYPYIDVKYRALDDNDERKVEDALSKYLEPYIVCSSSTTASELLKTILADFDKKIVIDDRVTGGLLQRSISTPDNIKYCDFCQNHCEIEPDILIKLTGLEAYWLGQEGRNHMQILVELTINSKTEKSSMTLGYEPLEVLPFVTELISSKLIALLRPK